MYYRKMVFLVLVFFGMMTIYIGYEDAFSQPLKPPRQPGREKPPVNEHVKDGAVTYQTPKVDPELYVESYNPASACNGTTLLADLHKPARPRIIEVNMKGEIVWEYIPAESLRKYTNPGFDVELLPNNNILFVLPRKGVYEINRKGDIIWSYLDDKISHDADRLPNGNTLYVWGGGDKKDEAQVKEVNPEGKLVWSWSAKKEFDKEPYKDIYEDGWTHANAATRLANGNTVICLRNFYHTVEVNKAGEIVWSFDWNKFGKDVDPHEPEILPNNNMLIALQNDSPYQAVEIKRENGEVVWKYRHPDLRTTRDADRLPNGNTLLVGVIKTTNESVILEVTPDGTIVWKLGIKDAPATKSPGWFYKAERIIRQKEK